MTGYLHKDPPPLSRLDVKKELQKLLRSRTESLRLAIGDHKTQFARKIGIEATTVLKWFDNGRVSPWGALVVERHLPALTAAWLRPDVQDWADIKKRGKHKGRF